MKYAHLEQNTNKLLGWYLENDKDRIEVLDKVWQEALNINANCYENGIFIVKDFRSNEEIEVEKIKNKIQEANSYLTATDWVETYKLRHDLDLELIPEDSLKWEVINKREEYIEFLKGAN